MDPKKTFTNGGTADHPVKSNHSSPKKGDVTQDDLKRPDTATESEVPAASQDGASFSQTPQIKAHDNREAAEQSPSSLKRISSESPEEPTIKKRKMQAEESADSSSSTSDITNIKYLKENWQGFCEIESDPAYFSVILREIGVEGVNVEELHMLEPNHLMTLPAIYGLVLLFRAREFDQNKQEATCPDHVWFANQMPGQNSCATLAMIHTLLNVDDPDIDIGDHMRQFKNFTQDMPPPHRGHTFASWNFVKKIHNKFAKKMDVLENDKYIVSKAAQAEKRKAAGPGKAAPPKTTSKSRSKPARGNSEDGGESDAFVEEFEANAHHYIAFVPVDGEVWKLDGMDIQPTLMGTYDENQGEMWFDAVSDRINALIGAGDNDYGIFAITQSPRVPLRNKLIEADNTIKHVDARMTAINTDWRNFLGEDDREPPSPSFMGFFTEEQRNANSIPGSIRAAIDNEGFLALLDRHRSLVAHMRDLVIQYMEKEQEEEEQTRRANDRCWDYGPAIQKWIDILARNGYLEETIQDFAEK